MSLFIEEFIYPIDKIIKKDIDKKLQCKMNLRKKNSLLGIAKQTREDNFSYNFNLYTLNPVLFIYGYLWRTHIAPRAFRKDKIGTMDLPSMQAKI